MRLIRDGLTTQEMGEIVSVRDMIRESLYVNTIGRRK
jgi:hypothetical protein